MQVGMGTILESLAGHICGSVANGVVSSDLEEAWSEFFRPDFARLGASAYLSHLLGLSFTYASEKGTGAPIRYCSMVITIGCGRGKLRCHDGVRGASVGKGVKTLS
jgi:hypothetical protein